MLQVLIQLRGHGDGTLSYLTDYKFEVKSSHQFTLAESLLSVEVVAWEKEGARIETRPAIRYVERVKNIIVLEPTQPVGHPEPDAAPEAPSQPTNESTSPVPVPAEGARSTDAPRQ